MSQDAKTEFSSWRAFFWPVHAYELKKILPMFIMFLLISFNYTILRDTKDTLVVSFSGAETIPFLKVYGVVPCAILFMLVYAKLSNMLSKENLFYAAIIPFIVFFGLFAWVLYPNKVLLHPTTSADYLQSILPLGLAGLVSCYRDWTLSLFYIVSELWGSAVLSLMFWGFANEIMRVTEAKRIYTLLGIGANIALLISGKTVKYLSLVTKSMTDPEMAWQYSLNYLMSFVIGAGVLITAIYWWMNRQVLTDPRYYDPTEEKKGKKSKPKMGIMESFTFLAKSKYIRSIAILVIAYGICINLVEVTWKSQLKLAYPNKNDYNAFMGDFSFTTGAITIVMMLVGGWILRKKGWGTAAMITPIVLLVTGCGFFAFILFRDNLQDLIGLLGTTPLILAVYFGMAQNILSKSTKYSLFDPTKEMTYIPLDQESKVKGKAAIDVVGARLGKSGGSFLQQGLLLVFGTIGAITPWVAIAMIVCIVGWLFAVKSLNKQFLALTTEKTPSPTAAKPISGTPAEAS